MHLLNGEAILNNSKEMTFLKYSVDLPYTFVIESKLCKSNKATKSIKLVLPNELFTFSVKPLLPLEGLASKNTNT